MVVQKQCKRNDDPGYEGESCKVEIPLDIHVTAQQLSKRNGRMTGIYEESKKRGFTDCSTEMFYVDYIEPGQPKKAPFVLRSELTIIYPCFLKANRNLSF